MGLLLTRRAQTNGGQTEEAVKESSRDDLDQNPEFDPTEPEPIPQDTSEQTRDA